MTALAKQIIQFLLNDERLSLVPMKPALVTSRLVESRIYNDAWQAEESVPRSGWRDWRSAGVQFSSFHKEGTPFALPFRPDSYVWAGPFTLRMPEHDLQIGQDFRKGHYRRGVRKYANMLSKGLKVRPLILLYHEAWAWTLQDGNHRYEALVKAKATTYDVFLGKPKRKMPIDSF